MWGRLFSVNRKGLDSDFDLIGDSLSIGRSELCEIHILNPKISKVHCVISRDESSNTIFVEDKASNGTYLNDDLIGKDKKIRIYEGDVIYLLHKEKLKGKVEEVGLVLSLVSQPQQPALKSQYQTEKFIAQTPPQDYIQATYSMSQQTNVDSQPHTQNSQSEIERQLRKELTTIKELLKEEQEKKRMISEEIGDEFKCGICFQYIYDCATVMPCLHNYCSGCISEMLLLQQQTACPTCRDAILYIKRNSQFNAVITKFINASPELRRQPEEYEELDLKSVILSTSTRVAVLQAAIIKKSKTKDYQMKLQEIRRLLNNSQKEEIDSDYSYQSEGDNDDYDDNRRVQGYLNQGNNNNSNNSQSRQPPQNRQNANDCPECVIARDSDGFKCDQNSRHLSCKSCQRRFPDRGSSSQVQKCVICSDAYCGLYLVGNVCRGTGSNNDKNGGFLCRMSDFRVPANITSEIFRNNAVEFCILDDFMHTKRISTQDIYNFMLQNFVATGKFFYERSKAFLANYSDAGVRVQLQSDSAVCKHCFDNVWPQLVFKFRMEKKNELPEDIAKRPMCHWGINCTTQLSKASHAERFDHVNEQRKF